MRVLQLQRPALLLLRRLPLQERMEKLLPLLQLLLPLLQLQLELLPPLAAASPTSCHCWSRLSRLCWSRQTLCTTAAHLCEQSWQLRMHALLVATVPRCLTRWPLHRTRLPHSSASTWSSCGCSRLRQQRRARLQQPLQQQQLLLQHRRLSHNSSSTLLPLAAAAAATPCVAAAVPAAWWGRRCLRHLVPPLALLCRGQPASKHLVLLMVPGDRLHLA